MTTVFHRQSGDASPQAYLAALATITAACLLAACGGGDSPGPQGTAALVKSTAEPAGANCAAGGTRVQSGLDLDRNAVLDLQEITATSFICNGAAGAAGAGGAPGAAAIANLVRTAPEPAGANCASGGIRIQSGADTSGNGSLEPLEVTQTSYACNGATGTTGAAGSAGPNSLIRTSPEGAGANCPAGGLKVESGLDTSRDGALQPAEVTATNYICRAAAATAKSWGTAEVIETLAGNVDAPQVAMNASGKAIAVWSQRDAGVDNIYSSVYTSGAGANWSAPQLIEAGAGTASNPKISINAFGDAIAVWTQQDGANRNVYANRYGAWGGWGTAQLIDSLPGSASLPQIAIDASGDAIAIWEQVVAGISRIYANRYTQAGAAAGWGTALSIDDVGASDAFNPKIAIDGNGNAIAVWDQLIAGTGVRIFANRFNTRAVAWGTASRIDNELEGDSQDPQISINASGKAAIVWTNTIATDTRIRLAYNDPLIGWSASNFGIADGESFLAGTRVNSPQVVTDARGSALVVWREQASGAINNIYSALFTPPGPGASATLSNAELIENSPSVSLPRIAIDANGNAVAVWEQSLAGFSSIWANRYTAGIGWGRPALIETDERGNALNPQVAVDASGNAVAVWQQSPGGATFNIVANDLR